MLAPHSCLRCWLGVGAWLTLTFASAEPAASELPPIELPKFEVTDSRVLPPMASWHYASIPGFEIISSISVSQTKRFVADFLLLQAAINEIMPGFTGGNVTVPTSLILTGRGNDFERFMPTERGDDRYRSTGLVWRVATLAAQRNFLPEALALARHGVKISRDPADRNRFETLVHALERDAVSPPPSP